MKKHNFPILSSVMMFPMVIAPLFLLFLQNFITPLSENFGLPAWLEPDVLSSNFLLAVVVCLIFFVFFSYHERYIRTPKKYSIENFISVLIGFGVSAMILEINFREFAQAIGGNIFFSFLSLFFLACLVPVYKPKIFGLLICFIAGLFFGSSGSKASLFSIILLWIICSGKNSFRYFLLIILGILVLSVINLGVFLRYMDVGLSMLNSMQICQYSEKSLIELYFSALSQYIFTGSTFNPTMVFYENVGLASAGYNITPTVIGDVVCRPNYSPIILLIILTYLHLSLSFGYKIFERSPWINNFHLLVLLGIMSSSTFDILKFEVLFWTIGLIYLTIKTYNDKKKYNTI
tara:strand:+ start:1146 stop:2186 length:1041 start_codon:yes stop_codon:yes gene_type:complete